MRKKAILSVITALMILLTACGGSEGAADNAPAAGTDEEATETSEPAEEAKVSRDAGGLGGDDSDLPYHVGPWKFDEYAIYLYLAEDYTWESYNARGEVTAGGEYYETGESFVMEYDDGSPDDEYIIEDTGLIDQDGNTLSKVDHMIFLPTKDDPLDKTVNFHGLFEDVTVDYPETLTAADREGTDNTIIFQPTVGLHTADARCSIQISQYELQGTQKRLQAGSGPAKTSMVNMLNNILYNDYSEQLLKVIDTDFKDCGTYYSITGYTWFDSNIFPTDDGKLYKGACEVRYYGPNGFCTVIMTIGPPERIEEYHQISQNIMDTYSYTSDWTTSPKTVPSEPGKASGGSSGSAYYWTDSDGDIWYWNGSYNEFVSFGSDGYIDDGEYYESNDAGWDDEDTSYYESNDAGWDYYDDYDVYSDPGDGYDAWSDPGDYEDTSGWDDY